MMDAQFWATMQAAQAQRAEYMERSYNAYRTADQQQQWRRGFTQTNPFTQEPVRSSAVAAEAHRGLVIEGECRAVPTT